MPKYFFLIPFFERKINPRDERIITNIVFLRKSGMCESYIKIKKKIEANMQSGIFLNFDFRA